ncbi:MAG: hypothetical protein D6776_11280, partial [Planctomycetota bacterium]
MTISGVGSGATSGPVDEPPVAAPEEAASPEPAAPEAAPAAAPGNGAPSGAWSTEGHLLQERASGWNTGATPPAFDRWNLTPEVKRLFLALGDATSAEQAEQTVNALLEQGVPREQIEEVL